MHFIHQLLHDRINPDKHVAFDGGCGVWVASVHQLRVEFKLFWSVACLMQRFHMDFHTAKTLAQRFHMADIVPYNLFEHDHLTACELVKT